MARFISLFAGVGGFDLGMERAGHECVAQVEWDGNAAGVLKRRWPDVPLFCDVSKVSADDLPDADFITYGFPCQDLSVAGKREGLNGQRSGLFYEATRLIRELRARGCGLRIAVAENVAGLFSADDGVALARCIRELLDCGACETGWRLLDSQYFGVAQRRKRVFIVSDFGGESVDEILAVTESLPGHPPPGREAGQGTAGDASKGVGEGGDVIGSLAARDYKGVGNQFVNEGKVIAQGGSETGNMITQSSGSDPELMSTLCAKDNDKVGSNQWVNEGKALVAQGADVYNGELTGETAVTVTSATGIANASGPKVIEQKETYCLQGGGETSQSSQGSGVNKDVAFTLNGLDKHGVVSWNGDVTPKASEDVSVTLRSQQGGEGVGVAHVTEGPCYENHPGDSRVTDSGETCPTITKRCGTGGGNLPLIRQEREVIAFDCDKSANEGSTLGHDVNLNPCLRSGTGKPNAVVNTSFMAQNLTVRRLTPVECERLQGFPDGWTSEKMEVVLEGNEWKATGKVVKQADGPRYKAMGNAVTVNVAEWLGKRIGGIFL